MRLYHSSIPLTIVLSLCLIFCSACTSKPSSYTAEYYDLFDTYSYLTVYGVTQEQFNDISEALHTYLLRFHELTDIYHAYDTVNLYELNQQAGGSLISVDPLLFDFLVWCRDAYDITEGRVNIALGPVTALWHQARQVALDDSSAAYVPSTESLREADLHTSIHNLILDEATCSIGLADPEASVDVGALAKGYAGRLAVDFLRQQGLENFLLYLGGNICAFGKPLGTGRDYYVIGIEDPSGGVSPSQRCQVSDRCVVTSGDYQRYYELNGVRYHHILDPATLYPSDLYHSVTVIHPDSAIADMLSTALFLMPEKEGRALAAQYDAQVIY